MKRKFLIWLGAFNGLISGCKMSESCADIIELQLLADQLLITSDGRHYSLFNQESVFNFSSERVSYQTIVGGQPFVRNFDVYSLRKGTNNRLYFYVQGGNTLIVVDEKRGMIQVCGLSKSRKRKPAYYDQVFLGVAKVN